MRNASFSKIKISYGILIVISQSLEIIFLTELQKEKKEIIIDKKLNITGIVCECVQVVYK